MYKSKYHKNYLRHSVSPIERENVHRISKYWLSEKETGCIVTSNFLLANIVPNVVKLFGHFRNTKKMDFSQNMSLKMLFDHTEKNNEDSK